jgi:hypothetical protein
MKYEALEKRRVAADILTKALVEKVQRRSEELNDGRLEWAFVAGYLESAIASIASESPASLKALARMVK